MTSTSYPGRRWVIAPEAPDAFLAEAAEAGIDRLLARLLYNRGLPGGAACREFLRGVDGGLGDPFALDGMVAAVEQVRRAIGRGEAIGIYGDFDVDGVTGTALLWETLTLLGARVIPYLPNRFRDGYGVKLPGVESLIADGARLIVTVDCGISAASEIAFARERGVAVVVVDHHTVTGVLPEAAVILNPRKPDCPSSFKDLAAVGVAFKLAQALLADAPGADEQIERLLELVALGTVADVVPLLGENRVLAARGVRALARTRRPGVAELLRRVTRTTPLDADTLGYGLGPRLNAPGRLGDARPSLEILTTTDPARARALADVLEESNRRRQQLTEAGVRAVRAEIGTSPGGLAYVARPDLSLGIIGLVAARLAEEHRRPAVIISVGEGESRGSVRSGDNLDVIELLQSVADLLLGHGGHARAGGFAVPTHRLAELRRRLEAHVATKLAVAGPDARPTLAVDAELAPAEVDGELPTRLACLAPFGHRNPHPVFVSRRLRVLGARTVGRTGPDHLKLRLHDGRFERDAIGFGMGSALGAIGKLVNGYVDLAHRVEHNEWNGVRALQLRVLEWQPANDRSG